MDHSSSESSDEELIPQTKKVQKTTVLKSQPKSVQDLQDMSWEIGAYKKVKLNNYKEKLYIDLREYFFDKNGQSLPTKKGVSFSYTDLPLLLKIL